MPRGDGTGPLWQRRGMGWRECRRYPDRKEHLQRQLESLEETRRNLQQRLDELNAQA